MSELRWYRISLALPLAVPAVVCVLLGAVWALLLLLRAVSSGAITMADGSPVATLAAVILAPLFVLALSGLLGGIQYAVFAAALLLVLRRRPVASWRRAARWAPLLFLPLQVEPLAFVMRFSGGRPLDAPGFTALGFCAVTDLVLGYVYVAIALRVGRRIRARAAPVDAVEPAIAAAGPSSL